MTKLGQRGEQVAQHFLKSKGFQLVALNWRYGKLGELDIVACHSERRLLAFVEVKTRKNQSYGLPEESVTPRKQTQLRTLALAYLQQHPPPEMLNICFDVISIYFPGHDQPAIIRHIEQAF